MPFDPTRLGDAVAAHFGDMPHPDVPELKVNQYAAFARAAARMFDTNRPDPEHVQTAHHALVNVGVAPAEFERIWDVARPLANRLLSRDPTLHDLAMLAGHPPAAIQAYYQDHPHPDAPDVSAGKMATYEAHAAPLSQTLHGRDPNYIELRRFALGNYSIEDMQAHYLDDGTSLRGKQDAGG